MSQCRPLILAIETSTDACSVALGGPWSTQQQFEVNPRGHATSLLPMVRDLLSRCGVKAEQLDAIAFAAGPGSFTGLRIAAGVTQGLALALGKPVISISTLAAIAAGITLRRGGGLSAEGRAASRTAELAVDEPLSEAMAILPDWVITTNDLLVMPLLDARMGEVYVGQYRLSGSDQVAMTEDRLLPPELVPVPSGSEPLLLIGSGLVYRERLPAALLKRAVWFAPMGYPQAAAVAELAQVSFRNGLLLRPEEAQPVYLRDEVAWQKSSPLSRQRDEKSL